MLAAGIERLLDEEVSLSARDARGFGPLHLAALHGLGDLVRMLLRAGAGGLIARAAKKWESRARPANRRLTRHCRSFARSRARKRRAARPTQ